MASKYRVVLLLFVVLGIYFPAIHVTINPIDDVFIFDAYGINGKMTLADILRPGNGFYYRPLINLSYYLDNLLWGLDPSFMHLENVLLHAANTLLVYLLAQKILIRSEVDMPLLPLLSSLLFALHPINTEAVCWIAGRTDPLAALFILAAAYILVKGLDEHRRGFVCLSVVFFLLGVLAKEVVIVFLPAALLIVFRWPPAESAGGEYSAVRKTAFLSYIFALFSIVVILSLHFLARKGDNSLSMIAGRLAGNEHGLLSLTWPALQAYGFYVKKLLVPLPLNFAIASLSNNYFWLGLVLLPLLWLLARAKHLFPAFLLIGLLFIFPAILVAVLRITWTPVAERYLYLPSAFFSIGLVGSCHLLAGRRAKRFWLNGLLSLVITSAAFFTMQRIQIWQDNLALLRDTMHKSPGFGVIRNEFAVALMKDGKFTQASAQLKIAEGLNNRSEVQRMIKMNQLSATLAGLTPDQARKILLQSFTDKRTADTELLKMLRKYDEARFSQAGDLVKRKIIAREIIDSNDHLFAKTGDPLFLYNSGQLYLFVDDKPSAGASFRKAYNQASQGAYYKEAAKQLAEKLN